ncbi:carboxypeptidase-like regulatory domain-containing protein [Edaphobacter modestus]|uniref:Carboxypeptidase family protein n=1 Tax=Edaphobacter modestus TaxID=388466 RepID=A0A4Q7YPI7_9BACT|nr:carboxypeptidase-like regulatory domain-containing protein [Edaphobacter modestus]RZU39350.1 hypothetical protein BDD14_0721 [Edaphobacter modestus]
MRNLSVGMSAIKKVCILLMSLASALGAAAQKVPEDQASISGRVVDVSGSPYSAQVRIFQIVIREGFAYLYPMCVTNTDQQGGFECPKLQAGKFIVQVLSLRRWGKQTQKAQDAAAGTIPKTIFYPGVTDLEQATPISLRSNEVGWAEVRVADSPGVEVTGTLTDHGPGAFLILKAESGGLTLNIGINPQYDSNTGRFVISNVPAGHYQLTANWFVSQGERHTTLPFVVDATPVDNLLLSPTPNVEISGQLPTLPLGVTISQLLLTSTDDSTRNRNTAVKDGAFNFGSVPAGEYILSFPLGQQVYVDAVSVGGKSVGGSRFSVAPGQGTLNLELEVKWPSIPIRGSVKEWEGSAVSAEVIAQAEDSGEIYKVTTDKQRNFSFAGVKRGEYRLFSWPGVNTIEYRNPLVLRKYNSDSTEVWVDQDGIGSAIELSPIEKER